MPHENPELLKVSQLTFDTTENAAELLSDFLLGAGSLGVAEDIKPGGGYQLSSYFPMDTDLSSLMEDLREFIAFVLETVPGAEVGPIRAELLDRTSWEVWKTLLGKVRAGKRVVVVPPWEEHEPGDGEVVVEINPSLAFGTGHHETTRLCIAAIERHHEGGRVRKMLDVGCGSGILAITASKLGIPDITAFDTDPIAMKESVKNAGRNSVAGRVKFFCGYIQSVTGEYDLIVANVYLEPIFLMREEFKKRLAPGGTIVLSGIPLMRRGEAIEGMLKAGFTLSAEHVDGEWVALELTLPREGGA